MIHLTLPGRARVGWGWGGCQHFLRSDNLFFFFCFLGPHVWHMESPRLGVESELQLPTYTTATAMQGLSRVCDLHHSSRPRWILNPQSKARDRTCNLMVLSRIHFHGTTTGMPQV